MCVILYMSWDMCQTREKVLERVNYKSEAVDLKTELRKLQHDEISLRLMGSESSPEEIACACVAEEKGTYMRDYIIEEGGQIRQIDFIFVKES